MTPAYSGVVNLEVMAEAVNYNQFLLGEIRSRLPGENAPVMDFGAGSGTFAAPLHEAGVPVTCVEPDEGLRQRLSEYGLAVVRDVDGLQPQTFSFIYSLNVLEHIENDQAALERLRHLLAPNGVLLLYVPAFQLLYSSMDRKVGHFRRYRRPALMRLLTSTGYIVEYARYVDSIGFLAALAYRCLGRDDGAINRSALKLYDRWVFPVSVALDRLAGRWFGKNVLVTARVPAK
jgi:SAM-dependent methyltransferase